MKRWTLVVTLVLAVVLLACGAWVALRASAARSAVSAARTDGLTLKSQVQSYNFVAAAATMKKLRHDADRAHSITKDPAWWLAAHVPVEGRKVAAARDVSAAVANIADAAQPFETALPQLQPDALRANGGRISIPAITEIAQAMPNVSAAVGQADSTINDINVTGLPPQIANGVITLRSLLGQVRAPMADAVPTLQALPDMLGGTGARTWMVLFEQDAEARGTGGLVGSYGLLTTNAGKVTLDSAASRTTLDAGAKIPTDSVPADLRDLWSSDLSEWAGLNLSPNFPWTGQLVHAGWAARGGKPGLDYVAAVDSHAVAAMLQAIGPVTINGTTIDSTNAEAFLTTGIYAKYADPKVVDAVTEQLVATVFAKFSTGQFSLPALIKAMKAPVLQRRVLLWAANPNQELGLSGLTVGGELSAATGPFAMAVINNGGGNKLDAYLHVSTNYQPGTCNQNVRIGTISVSLHSSAPASGLPAYVTERNDSRDLHAAHVVPGSNEELLDIYGPVGANAPLITIDGATDTDIVAGTDRGHTVWRVRVPIDPGQTRQVVADVVEPVTPDDFTTPVVVQQPMVNPVTTTVGPVPACVN